MMKGSITVFLALSLSILTGFVLLLTNNAIKNAGKIRLEGAVDLGMNSVLGEFHTGLHERYGLLYIDLSYEGREPCVQNLETRLDFYTGQNTDMYEDGSPWGKVSLGEVKVVQVASAAYQDGNSMKYQAVRYMQDCENEGEYNACALSSVQSLEGRDAMSEWSGLMEQIAGMELPWILNDAGEWEEVLLANPADAVFGLAGSNLLYLVGVDVNAIGVGIVPKYTYASERALQNLDYGEIKQADTELFVSYLFEKMGNYKRVRENSFMQYQLEYIAMGEASDYENVKGVIERLFAWRFAENVSYAMSNSELYGEAMEIAGGLHAVMLKEEFLQPVTESIVYACAYLESLAEVRCLMRRGGVEIGKSCWYTQPEQVISVSISEVASLESGFYYEDYLFAMIMLLSERDRNLRSMDIMEMDIRMLSQNPYFAMDFCIDRIKAETEAGKYYLTRTYGYY